MFMGELLRQFIPEPLLAAFDLEAMERVNAKLHTDAGRCYEGDIIWRLPLRGGSSVYLMVLLEFQSQLDPLMALRMITYTWLLWNHLRREGRLLRGKKKLPPVPLLVLYNETRRSRYKN